MTTLTSLLDHLYKGDVVGGTIECYLHGSTFDLATGRPLNLPATMPGDASKLYGKNILNFLQLIVNKEGNLHLNFEDDLVKGTCIVHEKMIVNDRLKSLIN